MYVLILDFGCHYQENVLIIVSNVTQRRMSTRVTHASFQGSLLCTRECIDFGGGTGMTTKF